MHRCRAETCVVEISQHPLFVGNTGAMHVQSLVGLEAPVILDVLQSLCIVLQHLNGDEQANRQDASTVHALWLQKLPTYACWFQPPATVTNHFYHGREWT